MGRLSKLWRAVLFYAQEAREERIAGTPRATVAPEITGTPTVGQELTLSNGTFTPTPVGYRYEWRRDGDVIAGATLDSYTLVGDDEGAMVTGTVYALGASSVGGATSAAVGPVEAA